MVKAIVMDVDGTLVNSNGKIPPKTKDILIQLQKNNKIQIIIASGRNYRRLMDLAHELKMEQYGGYFIEVDGIIINDLKNRCILKQMEVKEIEKLFNFLMAFKCEIQVCSEEACFSYFPSSFIPIKEQERKERNLPDSFPWTAGPWTWNFDMKKAYGHIFYIQSVKEVYGKINKIQIMAEKDHLQKIFEQLQSHFNNQFEFFRTSYRQIEILPFGFNKGSALKQIMEIHHWSKEEVIAFGDGENDVSLFQQVDKSYAMAQAQDYVKKQAKYMTLSNDEEGIYIALKDLNIK